MSDDFSALRQQAIAQMRKLQAQAEPPPEPPPESPPESPPQPPNAPNRPPQRQGFLSRFLRLENDTALLLPLLLFLGREGADDGLLLALLYIMS